MFSVHRYPSQSARADENAAQAFHAVRRRGEGDAGVDHASPVGRSKHGMEKAPSQFGVVVSHLTQALDDIGERIHVGAGDLPAACETARGHRGGQQREGSLAGQRRDSRSGIPEQFCGVPCEGHGQYRAEGGVFVGAHHHGHSGGLLGLDHQGCAVVVKVREFTEGAAHLGVIVDVQAHSAEVGAMAQGFHAAFEHGRITQFLTSTHGLLSIVHGSLRRHAQSIAG